MISIVLLALLTAKFASAENSDIARALNRDCVHSYSMTCLKLDIVSYVDGLNEETSYDIYPGISLVKDNATGSNTADMVAELAREFPNDVEARLDAFLLGKIKGFLSSHSIRFNLLNPESVESARKKDKKGGGLGYILAAGAMMKGTLMAIAMGGLAALAGKALMTGMISLLLSAIIGLKSLTHHSAKQTTYEIISKPLYQHTNSHSVAASEDHGQYSSPYARSMDVPLPLGLHPAFKH